MNEINIGPLTDIPLGQGACYIVKDRKIAVFRIRDGSIAAIDNVCPHRMGNLADGITDDKSVICPLHGHKFDLKTGAGAEAEEYVDVFAARVENGNIIISY